MKIEMKKFNEIVSNNQNYIINFIKNNYDAPEHLLPTVEEFEKLDLHVLLASEPVDLFEAGNVGDKILGVTFFKKVTDSLVKTRTTVVAEDYRGKGVATRLNEELEDYCKSQYVNKISCNIFVDNIPSLFLKLKRGYIVEGLLKDHIESGKDEYLVSKFL
jgi:RimJ/RimL family protein N-acetyltransferase